MDKRTNYLRGNGEKAVHLRRTVRRAFLALYAEAYAVHDILAQAVNLRTARDWLGRTLLRHERLYLRLTDDKNEADRRRNSEVVEGHPLRPPRHARGPAMADLLDRLARGALPPQESPPAPQPPKNDAGDGSDAPRREGPPDPSGGGFPECPPDAGVPT